MSSTHFYHENMHKKNAIGAQITEIQLLQGFCATFVPSKQMLGFRMIPKELDKFFSGTPSPWQ
jgi:hypothetical protein